MNSRAGWRGGSAGRWAMALLAAAWGLAGCDWFEDPSPDEARLVLAGEPTETVHIVTSRFFVTSTGEDGTTQVQLFSADTLVQALPFDRTYDIRDEQRFFAQISRNGEPAPSVRMRVLLDGSERLDQSAVLEEPLWFVFQFNQPTLLDIDEVL